MWQADGRHRAHSWGKANLQFDTFQLPAAKLREWMWREEEEERGYLTKKVKRNRGKMNSIFGVMWEARERKR